MKNLSVLILALATGAAGQTSTKCSDLTKLRIPGVNLVITKAETIPASAADPSHCQADDFAQVAVGRVTEIAKQIVAQYYGQPARFSYFAGCRRAGGKRC